MCSRLMWWKTYFQPVEIDARAYAAEETERLQGLIDKELQKET